MWGQIASMFAKMLASPEFEKFDKFDKLQNVDSQISKVGKMWPKCGPFLSKERVMFFKTLSEYSCYEFRARRTTCVSCGSKMASSSTNSSVMRQPQKSTRRTCGELARRASAPHQNFKKKCIFATKPACEIRQILKVFFQF